MALFSSAKESLTFVGILAVPREKLPKILRKYQSVINCAHVIFVLGSIMIYFCLSLHFLVFKANTVSNYFESGSFCVLNIMRIIVYLNLYLEIKKMSDLWNDLETTVNKRNLNI